MKSKIQELMKALHADGIKRGVSWKGYKVYKPTYNKEVFLGLPYVIFEKGEEIRLSTPEESLEYLEYSIDRIGKEE